MQYIIHMLEGMVFKITVPLPPSVDEDTVSKKCAKNLAQQLLAMDVQALSITMCLNSLTTH